MYRFPLLAGIFIVFLSPLSAQRVGLSAGYLYTQHKAMDQAVRYFNFSHPSHGTHAFLRHGFYASIEYSMAFKKKVFFLAPRFTYWESQSETEAYVYPITSINHGIDISLGANWYLLAKGSNQGKPRSFARNFFLSLQLGASRVSHQIEAPDRSFLFQGQKYLPTATTPFAHLGIGYDIFTLAVFSFTPEVSVGYLAPFSFAHLSEVYTSESQTFEEISPTGRFYIQAGLAIRLHSLKSTYR